MFPHSKKFIFKPEDKVWSGDINMLDGKVFDGVSAGMEYRWRLTKAEKHAIEVEISSKSVVTIIVVLSLAGAIIPGIGIEGFLIYAVIVSVLLYFLLFSILSASVFNKIKVYLVDEGNINVNNCEDCCPACGAKVSESDLFCPACGLRLKQNNFTRPLNTSKYTMRRGAGGIRYVYKKKDKNGNA